MEWWGKKLEVPYTRYFLYICCGNKQKPKGSICRSCGSTLSQSLFFVGQENLTPILCGSSMCRVMVGLVGWVITPNQVYASHSLGLGKCSGVGTFVIIFISVGHKLSHHHHVSLSVTLDMRSHCFLMFFSVLCFLLGRYSNS